MAEIEVAVFAFNEVEELKLVNRAGERLWPSPRSDCSVGKRRTSISRNV
jgi:hypothetical protein